MVKYIKKRLAELMSTLFTSMLYPFQLKSSSCKIKRKSPTKAKSMGEQPKT